MLGTAPDWGPDRPEAAVGVRVVAVQPVLYRRQRPAPLPQIQVTNWNSGQIGQNWKYVVLFLTFGVLLHFVKNL